ncbi:hypothetical protein G7Y79_00042g078460 [Physcia stellaris]|nr:hypothetical protein G7Y79_00042g078460 [Physcia stellaris]
MYTMMSMKRKSGSVDVIKPMNAKRYRTSESEIDSDALSKASQPRMDPTYGQRGAFPGLNDSNPDDPLFYGPASDGLEYLRMVRSEAKGVPNLLVAKSSAEEQIEGDFSNATLGYYVDGAYTAAPIPTNYGSIDDEDDDSGDPQEAYYSAFCSRFRSLSSILQNPPPSNFTHDSASYTAQRLSTGGRKVWRSALNTVPSMIVLSQLSQDAVLQGIQMLESRLANGGLLRKKTLSLWSWGLLARCRDAGQMRSEEIGILRDLGKRAIKRQLVREDPEECESNEENEHDWSIPEAKAPNSLVEIKPDEAEDTSSVTLCESPHHDTDIDDALAAAKARILCSLTQDTLALESSSPAKETCSIPNEGHSISQAVDTAGSGQLQEHQGEMLRLNATLDMIITVVGEFYGQKDLLEGRLVWGEVDMGGE